MEKIEFSTSEISASIEDIIKADGHFTLCVSGSSMKPFLVDGRDCVHLRRCTDSDFKKGRILLFRRDSGALVLHRIKKILPDGRLVMNGDAQFWCETILPEQVIGAVSDTVCNGKSVPCNSPAYRIKIFIWQLLFPVRPLIFRVLNKIIRMMKKNDK